MSLYVSSQVLRLRALNGFEIERIVDSLTVMISLPSLLRVAFGTYRHDLVVQIDNVYKCQQCGIESQDLDSIL